MTERGLSIIHVLGEKFATVLVDLQRTFEERMAAQSGVFEERLASLSALSQRHMTVDGVRPALQVVMNDAVGAIPVPHDGRDCDPGVPQQAVNDMVAKIPVPVDGKSVTADDIRPMIEQIMKDAVNHIPAPHDGRDYDPEVLQQAVNDAVARTPVPTDGKSVTADSVRPMIEQMVRNAASHIPAPHDGCDYDPEALLRMMNNAVGKLPVPADGESITPNDVRPMLEQMVTDAVSHIPVLCDGRDCDPEVPRKAVPDAVSALPTPRDGHDVAALEIFPTVGEQKSFPRGTYTTHQGELWRAYEKTHGMWGWKCLADGVADIDVSMTGKRSFIVMVRQSNGQCTEKTFFLSVMLYHDVSRVDETYHPGDAVTWGDSLRHCNSITDDKPGEAHSSGWILAAKRGQDTGGEKWQHY